MLHQARLKLPDATKVYAWGKVEVWIRELGACISTGYVAIHALGCWEGDTSRDQGSLIWRASDPDSKIIVGGFEALVPVPAAFRYAAAYTRGVVAGQHLGQAHQGAKKMLATGVESV